MQSQHGSWVTMIMFAVTLFLAPTSSTANLRPPLWKSGEVIQMAELIAVVDSVQLGGFIWISAPGIFSRDSMTIHRFEAAGVLFGNVTDASEVVVVQSQSDMKGSARILPGRSLLVLKRMDADDVEHLQDNMPHWMDDLPNEVWTFVEEEEQWMNWIQFTHRGEDEEVEYISSILVAQLARYAEVDRTEEQIIAYISKLIELRQAVLTDAELPENEELDRFQQDVMQRALQELQEGDD